MDCGIYHVVLADGGGIGLDPGEELFAHFGNADEASGGSRLVEVVDVGSREATLVVIEDSTGFYLNRLIFKRSYTILLLFLWYDGYLQQLFCH